MCAALCSVRKVRRMFRMGPGLCYTEKVEAQQHPRTKTIIIRLAKPFGPRGGEGCMSYRSSVGTGSRYGYDRQDVIILTHIHTGSPAATGCPFRRARNGTVARTCREDLPGPACCRLLLRVTPSHYLHLHLHLHERVHGMHG